MTGSPLTMGRIDWNTVLRHYLQVQAFCAVIAVFTTLVWPSNSYLNQLASSTITGMLMWLLIEFGRLLIPRKYGYPDRGGRRGWPRGWRGIALAAFGIAAGFLLGNPLGDWLLGNGKGSARDLQLSVLITLISGAVGTFYFHARGKAAALAADIAAAERDASEAKLKLLETQLEPHMLFNTLANLRALIVLDAPRAVAMLDRLDSYLRATLAGSRATQHPLAQEFDRLADYLELMAVRMGPRLSYTLELPPELSNHPIPTLLLQPLVENSIRHGLEPKVEGGSVKVSARREGDWLLLEVSDTGMGFEITPDGTPVLAGGFGMAQVRERLATAYGTRSAIESVVPPAGGTSTIIRFPYEILPP